MGEVYNFRKKQNKYSMKKIFTAIGVVVVIILTMLVYFNRYSPVLNRVFGVFTNGELQSEGNEFSFDINTPYQFGMYKNNLLMLGNDSVVSVNSKGEIVWETPVSLNSPTLQIVDKYILAYDRKGKECFVINNSVEANHVTTDQQIICAKLNKSGYFVVGTKETGSLGLVTVYNSKGEEIFKWYSGDNHILDVDISPDNSRIAVCVMNVDNGQTNSGVTFFKLNEDKPYAGVMNTETIFTNVKYNRNGTLIAVGNNRAVCYNKNGKEKWTYNYDGGILLSCSLSGDYYSFVIDGAEGSQGRLAVKFVSKNGRKVGSYLSDDDITSIVAEENIAAISSGRGFKIISASGGEIGMANVNRDIKKVLPYGDKKRFMVVGSNIADVYKFK